MIYMEIKSDNAFNETRNVPVSCGCTIHGTVGAEGCYKIHVFRQWQVH